MKSPFRSLITPCLTFCALFGATFQGNSTTVQVGVDPTQSWLGFMNVFNLPADGGGYQFGSPWGTADLPAIFTAGILQLSPNVNTYNARDACEL